MHRPTRKVLIVGGGAAGWITASMLAAERRRRNDALPQVALVESPDLPIIGVGEGTWPSMRMTLQRIGLAEDQLVRDCEASFKQGTRFFGWSGRQGADAYCHPFSWPAEYASLNPARHWLAQGNGSPFAEAVTPQASVIEKGLAPKQASAPEYAFTVNYGYHLDAVKFAALLRRHALDELGVTRISGTVEHIESHPDGDLAALVLDNGQRVEGDLFVDCTGQRALLIGQHYGRGLVSAADWLFNDRAIAVQVPYADPEQDPIASATCATAQAAGWIWDIGLQTRRGLGYVHSQACADTITGKRQANRNSDAWLRVYRALEHGVARRRCDDQAEIDKFPPEIRNFAARFSEIQQKRHWADYAPDAGFYREETSQLITEAEDAIRGLDNVPIQQRRAFAVHVLMPVRRS